MQHLHHKAVILHSYEDVRLLQSYLHNAFGTNTFFPEFDPDRFLGRQFLDTTIFFEYSDKLRWSWGLEVHSPYSLLPIQAILNPSDYPEYYI